MNDDWKIGDLAMCVSKVRRSSPFRLGGVYLVSGVRYEGGIKGLFFDDRPSSSRYGSWVASSFRKIKPDAAEPCDPEFVVVHLGKQRVHCDGVGR